VGWELWLLGLLGLEQYLGSGAANTDDLERWRSTVGGKDYLKRSLRAAAAPRSRAASARGAQKKSAERKPSAARNSP